jgi:hypothetical protein
MSPDSGMNVSFNGGSEKDSPYYKGDIGDDTGQTCLSRVDAFARRARQRRKQVVNHVKKRFDFFCMMKSAMKRFIGNQQGCGLYISSWFVVVSLVDNIRQKTKPITSEYKPIEMNDSKQWLFHH